MWIVSKTCLMCLFFTGAWLSSDVSAQAQNETSRQANLEQLRQQAVKQGLHFLAQQGQAEDGTFTKRAGSGVTALALTAALRNGRSADDPMVAKGLKALEGYVKPDGGIYGGGRLKNYETCVAMVAFAEANSDGRYNQILANAKKFLTGLQIAGEQRQPEDPWYGGVGYSGAGRPDMSNTAFFVEAMQSAGAEANDPAVQRALLFLSRCQNLDGHGNDTKFADRVGDGGFYYEIPTTDVDPASDSERFTANGGLRSYGTMTYAGLKSMIFAGLTKTDPRVQAAQKWIRNTYALDKNPGMGTAGLYYYYHTFGSALHAAGVEQVQDVDGKSHEWKRDLTQALAKRQNENGSWTNDNQRWMENDPNLATSFALIALSYCQPATADDEGVGK